MKIQFYFNRSPYIFLLEKNFVLEKKVARTETGDSCLLSDNWLAANGTLVKHLGAECQLGGSSVIKQFLQK